MNVKNLYSGTMLHILHLRPKVTAALLALYFFYGASAQVLMGQAVRSQMVSLQPGWNAVYLEVDPSVADPSGFLGDLPVDIVATHIAPLQPGQFVRDPTADLHLVYGWSVWYAPEREDAVLTTLYAIQGGRSYLMHAQTNVTFAVSGAVASSDHKWEPNTYNFVGFPVVDPGGPTFAAFFHPSPAHRHNRIYRLVEGTWRQVTHPANTVMRAGEAFWIYTEGRSDYRGPLEVRAASAFGVFLSGGASSEILFRNRSAHPMTFSVEHVVDGNDDIPMAVEVPAYDEEAPGFRHVTYTFEEGGWTQPFPTLEAGQGVRLPLRLHLPAASPGRQFSLLRVESDLGTVVYVPVTAMRDEVRTTSVP